MIRFTEESTSSCFWLCKLRVYHDPHDTKKCFVKEWLVSTPFLYEKCSTTCIKRTRLKKICFAYSKTILITGAEYISVELIQTKYPTLTTVWNNKVTLAKAAKCRNKRKLKASMKTLSQILPHDRSRNCRSKKPYVVCSFICCATLHQTQSDSTIKCDFKFCTNITPKVRFQAFLEILCNSCRVLRYFERIFCSSGPQGLTQRPFLFNGLE